MTLDLAGVRALVRRLSGDPSYADRADRVAQRLEEAGAPYHVRMAGLLWDATRLVPDTRRRLLDAGVPARVVEMVLILGQRDKLADTEYVRRVRAAGAEAVCRAVIEERLDGRTRVDCIDLLVTLDITDPQRRPDPERLVTRVAGSPDDNGWWYAVSAVGRLLHAPALADLVAAHRRLASADRARAHVEEALAYLVAGTWNRYWHGPPVPPDPRFEPTLVDLAGDDSSGLRRFAIVMLGRFGQPRHVALLRRALSAAASAPDIAHDAARMLGRLGAREAVDDLVRLLADTDMPYGWVRWAAAEALAELRDPASVDALVDALADPSPSIRLRAAYALGEIGGEQAVEALLRHNTGDTLRALGKLREPRAVPLLLERLARPTTIGIPIYAEALGRIGAPDAIEPLARIAADGGDERVRRTAVWAIGQIDPDAAIDALLLAAADPHPLVRQVAATALNKCRDPRALVGMVTVLLGGAGERTVLRAFTERPDPRALTAVLGVFLGTGDRAVRRLAGRALLALGPHVPDLPRRIFAAGYPSDVRLRRAVLWLLGRLGDHGYARWISNQLDDEDEIVRARAAAALAQLGPTGPEPAADRDYVSKRLVEVTSDPVPRVRANAVHAIAARGQDLAFVREALDDPHADVRAAAATALRRLESAVVSLPPKFHP